MIQYGITLQGGGALTFSDNSANSMFGTSADVLFTNLDNVISGAGQFGAGQMILVNKGAIIATGANALEIDTGANAVINEGTLEATGSGGLLVHGDVVNDGLLWANGGSLTIDGNVIGSGSALINGVATVEFGGAFNGNITLIRCGGTLDADAAGILKIDRAAGVSGVLTGFDSNDRIDFSGLRFGVNSTLNYIAAPEVGVARSPLATGQRQPSSRCLVSTRRMILGFWRTLGRNDRVPPDHHPNHLV